jgi:hypothetical protein
MEMRVRPAAGVGHVPAVQPELAVRGRARGQVLGRAAVLVADLGLCPRPPEASVDEARVTVVRRWRIGHRLPERVAGSDDEDRGHVIHPAPPSGAT